MPLRRSDRFDRFWYEDDKKYTNIHTFPAADANHKLKKTHISLCLFGSWPQHMKISKNAGVSYFRRLWNQTRLSWLRRLRRLSSWLRERETQREKEREHRSGLSKDLSDGTATKTISSSVPQLTSRLWLRNKVISILSGRWQENNARRKPDSQNMKDGKF